MEIIQAPYGSVEVTFIDASGSVSGAPVFRFSYDPLTIGEVVLAMPRARRAAVDALASVQEMVANGLEDLDKEALDETCRTIISAYERVIDLAFGDGASATLEGWLTGGEAIDPMEMCNALAPAMIWITEQVAKVYLDAAAE